MDGTIKVERVDGGRLELDGWGLASVFFTTDPSSVGVGAYDSVCGRTSADTIEVSDVGALNRTMRARTAHSSWEPLMGRHLPWLRDLDPELDLIEADDADWAAADAERLALAALEAVVGHGRGVSVATKMLHLKRPRLFPILDRLVAEMLGAPLGEDAQPTVRARLAANLVLHVRAQGRANLDALRDIQSKLAREGHKRSLVRILDAVLWLSHPAAGNTGPRRVLACRMEPLRVVNVDALDDNANWTKQTLDLYLPDGSGEGGRLPVDSVERMREWLRLHGMTVAEFKLQPTYRLALRKQPWLRDL